MQNDTQLQPHWYEQARALYERIVPLQRQGGADIRPVGERRRKRERITKEGDNYVIKYYDHDVATYRPDGVMTVKLPPWHTPTTAKFLARYTPFQFWKQYNQIWMGLNVAGGKANAVPLIGDVSIWRTEQGIHHNVSAIVKRATNRKRAKESRAHFIPFVDYCTTMLKMSDGWMTAETHEELSRAMSDIEFLHKLLMGTDDEWPTLYANAVSRFGSQTDNRRVTSGPKFAYDRRYNHKQVRSALYKFFDSKSPDIYDPVEVPVTNKAMCLVIGAVKRDLPV